MTFKVQNNLASLSPTNELKKNQTLMQQIAERLSSGKKINNASDDAAGLAASMRLRAEIGGLSVAVRNVMEAGSALQVADGGLRQTEGILIRMQELATQGASAQSASGLAAINSEMQALQSEIDRIAQTTSYNGQALLDGSYSEIFQVGDGSGETSRLQVALGDASTATLNAGTPFQVGIASAADAQRALDAITNALDRVASQRAEIGTYANRLDYQQANLQVSIENKIAAESIISDADMAKEIMDFTKVQILLQADTAVLAQANAASQAPLSLLKP